MPEVLWVLGVLLLIGAAAAIDVVPWPTLLEFGHTLMLRCAAVGVPLEIVYFTALGLALTWSGARPRGWFWKPFHHHHLLSIPQKALILPFFYAGAFSFAGIVLGILVVVLGILGALRQS